MFSFYILRTGSGMSQNVRASQCLRIDFLLCAGMNRLTIWTLRINFFKGSHELIVLVIDHRFLTILYWLRGRAFGPRSFAVVFFFCQRVYVFFMGGCLTDEKIGKLTRTKQVAFLYWIHTHTLLLSLIMFSQLQNGLLQHALHSKKNMEKHWSACLVSMSGSRLHQVCLRTKVWLSCSVSSPLHWLRQVTQLCFFFSLARGCVCFSSVDA
jgi:hypothetical protein